MPETLLLHLDLLSEALAESLLLFLELGVVKLPWTSLAKLSCLHLLCTVCFVMVLLGRVDEVEHVSPDENSAELLEVAVLLVLDFGDTPGVLTTLDGAAIVSLNILLGANDGKWHSINETASMGHSGSVVVLKRGLVDLDALSFNDTANLQTVSCLSSLTSYATTYPCLELE